MFYKAQLHFHTSLEKRVLNPLHAFATVFPFFLYTYTYSLFLYISVYWTGYSVPLLCTVSYIFL